REKCALVIPHEAGDEGLSYRKRVEEYAKFMGVDLRLIDDRIAKERRVGADGHKQYTLWDIYPHADFVSYPSIYEGYGNAFVEAIYFRKPILVNRYQIFEADIEPKGFQVVSFDGFITSETVQKVKDIMDDTQRLAEMAEVNYMLGWRYLSYEMLEEKFEALLSNIYGS
ncbi:MAG: glycosyltransferase family 1 protein, partial [Desulfobacterales bacterium]